MLKVAVIGLGLAAEPHLLSLADLKDTIQVVQVASRGSGARKGLAESLGFRVSADVDAAITEPGTDAVILLTPPSSHLELARNAFECGKDVLVEKPLDISLERASALVAAAERAGRRLGVVLQHRFRPGAVRLRQVVQAGELGEVVAASLNFMWWRPQSYYDEPGRGTYHRDGGGVLLTQAIHSIDLLLSLVGPLDLIASVPTTTSIHKMEAEDHVVALLRTVRGASVSFAATTACFPGRPEVIELIGTSGTAILTGGLLEVTWHDGRVETAGDSGSSGSGAGIMAFDHQAHREVLREFHAAIEAGRSPVPSGEDALAAQRLITKMMGRA